MSLDFYLQYAVDGNEISVFGSNITHNLTKMADAAGIYDALWRPDKKRGKKAKDIIPALERGLKKLKRNPKTYEKFNSSNGWGTYKHFVPFVEEVLAACKQYPNATIRISR